MNINYSKNEIIAYQKGYRAMEDGTIIGVKGNQLKLWKMPSDYWAFSAKNYKKTMNITVHRFVAYQKYGDKIFDDGIVVRHLDGNHLNNSFTNIEIGTQSDNIFDIPKERRSNQAKMSDRKTIYTIEDINMIKEFYYDNHTLKQTMEKFNISSNGKLRRLLCK